MITALDRIKSWTVSRIRPAPTSLMKEQFDLQHPIKVVESGSSVVLHVSVLAKAIEA